jgi:carboxyl-terminal processing protease
LTGLFVDSGPVVQVKDTVHAPKIYEDTKPGMAWSGPLVVLTSKFSASASEILAGAIQDYQRGLVVGDRATHGKGTVQSLLHLGQELFQVRNAPNLGALKVTMQKFYRPNGESTQVRGVLADIELPSITNHMDVSESDLDHVIEWDAVKPATYHKTAMVSNNMLAQLKTASAARQAESEEFAKLGRRITRYRERKDRQHTTLNEKAFLAERAELEEDSDDKDEDEDADEKKDDVIIDRNFYVDEALDLTVDYIRLLNGESLK